MAWINRVLFVKMTAESSVKLFCCCCINQPIISLEAFLEEQLAYQDAKYLREVSDLSGWQPDETQIPLWTYCCTPHCCEPAERPPPTTESEVGSEFMTCRWEYKSFSSHCQDIHVLFQLLQAFYRQQDEIRGLREQLNQKDVSIQTQSHKDTQGNRPTSIYHPRESKPRKHFGLVRKPNELWKWQNTISYSPVMSAVQGCHTSECN